LKQLRTAILLLIGTIIIGSTIFQFYYLPEYDPNYSGNLLDNILATIQLLLSLEVYDYPHLGELPIKLLYVVYPFLGLILIGIGLLEFGVVVFTYRYRLEAWNNWLANDMEKHTVLVGLGNVGTRILNELKEDGLPATVITLEKEKNVDFLQEMLEHPTIAVIFGDATQRSVLKEANVQKARALISVTNDDLANFKIATLAKEMNPRLRTVIRAFDIEFSKKATELFDIDAAISTSAIAAPAFVATSFEDGIIQTLKKGNTDFHLMEVYLSKEFSPITVEDIEKQYDITILAIDKQAHPESDDIVKSNDCLLVLGEITSLRRLKNQYS
jgi:Trk K+ transport system NAD-binding subunit